jgi:hypothetical protein
MMITLTKWKKQINLLDKETAAIIEKLEDAVVKIKTKRREARI